jgi:hypothetical protein
MPKIETQMIVAACHDWGNVKCEKEAFDKIVWVWVIGMLLLNCKRLKDKTHQECQGL